MSMNHEAEVATRTPRSSGGPRYAAGANAEPLVAYFADIAHIPTLSREEQVLAAKEFESAYTKLLITWLTEMISGARKSGARADEDKETKAAAY